MVDRRDQSQHDAKEEDSQTAHSRRELLGVIITLWLAGSLSEHDTVRLLYGFQGYGFYGFGGD